MVPAFGVITNADMGDAVGLGPYEFKLASQEIKPVGRYGSVYAYPTMVIGITRGTIAPCIRRKFIQDQVELNDAWFNRDVAILGTCSFRTQIHRRGHFVSHLKGLA